MFSLECFERFRSFVDKSPLPAHLKVLVLKGFCFSVRKCVLRVFDVFFLSVLYSGSRGWSVTDILRMFSL